MRTTTFAKKASESVSSELDKASTAPKHAMKKKISRKPDSRPSVSVAKAPANGAPIGETVRVKPPKMAKYGIALLEAEHDAMVEMKQKLSEALGQKVRKSDLLRAALRLLLSQSPAKVKAELTKVVAAKTGTAKKEK